MCCKEYQPMRAKELAVLLQIPAGKREELHKILDMLLEEGKISINTVSYTHLDVYKRQI